MENTKIILCGVGVGATTFSKNNEMVFDLTSYPNWRLIGEMNLCELVSNIYDKKLFKYILVPLLGDGVSQSTYFIKWSENFSVVVKENDDLVNKWKENGNIGLYTLSTKLGKDEYLSTKIDGITPIKL